jgi:predicted N-acetyltransferase YhbS
MSTWAGHDPDEQHVHLGPLAVDAHLQGRGIGSQIMREHCRRLDAAQHVGYLETDKPENVRFYERFGYEVTGTAPVIGVPNWFMRREPRGSAHAPVAPDTQRDEYREQSDDPGGRSGE